MNALVLEILVGRMRTYQTAGTTTKNRQMHSRNSARRVNGTVDDWEEDHTAGFLADCAKQPSSRDEEHRSGSRSSINRREGSIRQHRTTNVLRPRSRAARTLATLRRIGGSCDQRESTRSAG